jgi:hypothetical protein
LQNNEDIKKLATGVVDKIQKDASKQTLLSLDAFHQANNSFRKMT